MIAAEDCARLAQRGERVPASNLDGSPWAGGGRVGPENFNEEIRAVLPGYAGTFLRLIDDSDKR